MVLLDWSYCHSFVTVLRLMPPPGFCNNRISKGPRLGILIIDEVGDSPRLMLVPLMYLTGNRSDSNGILWGKPTSIFPIFVLLQQRLYNWCWSLAIVVRVTLARIFEMFGWRRWNHVQSKFRTVYNTVLEKNGYRHRKPIPRICY